MFLNKLTKTQKLNTLHHANSLYIIDFDSIDEQC